MRLSLKVCSLLGAVTCVGAHPLHAATDFTLQLRWTHQFQFAGYYIALERGYYDDAGLDVTLLEGGTDTTQPVSDLLAGEVDLAISNSGVVIKHMAGEPVVALTAIMQTSPMVWIVRADSGIHTAQDLADRRLMLMPPPESAELLAMMRKEGVDTSRLDLVPTSLDVTDLIAGNADAYDGYKSNEPYLLEQQGIDYRLIQPQEYGVNFYNDVLVTRKDVVESHPGEVEAFRKASLKGWTYALENIEETVDFIHEEYATHKSREHLLFEAKRTRELVMPELVELGHMNPARWQSIAETYVALGMANPPAELDGFLFTANSEPDLSWFYRILAASALGVLLISLVTMRIARLNRKLVREAAKRKRVEQELRENQAQLYHLANTDQLTGVWNRLKFEEIAQQDVKRYRRYEHPLSLIFMDVDHFKAINDGQGHGVGDRVLQEVVNLINEQLREPDWLCRWGGEEFLVLVPHTGLAEAGELAERLRDAIRTNARVAGASVTVSQGVATLHSGDNLDDLIARADRALYRAKERGRDRVVLEEE